jgi:hypothetical protein
MTPELLVKNLKNTILGKEMLLADYKGRLNHDDPETASIWAIGFLAANLTELKTILADAEQLKG